MIATCILTSGCGYFILVISSPGAIWTHILFGNTIILAICSCIMVCNMSLKRKDNSDNQAYIWPMLYETCVTSKGYHHPSHMHSLIKVFAVCMKLVWTHRGHIDDPFHTKQMQRLTCISTDQRILKTGFLFEIVHLTAMQVNAFLAQTHSAGATTPDEFI